MPEEAKTAVIEQFKPEHRFDFKGAKKSIPVNTAKVTRGANAGRIVLLPDLDKISYEDNAMLFNTDDLQEEIIIPGLRKLLFAIDKHCFAKNSKYTKNDKGEEIVVPDSTDWEQYEKDYQQLFTKLTLQSESIRALKLKKAELLKILMETDPSNMEAFRTVALQVQAIERQINDAAGEKQETEVTKAA